MLDEYTARNNRALEELVEVHGVELRQLPDEVIANLRVISQTIAKEMAADNPLAKRIADSVASFKQQAMAYHRISEEAYYRERSQQ